MKVIKLSEKEIQKLPFPDTARAIGGVLVPGGDDISEESLKKIRHQFYENMKNTKGFKTPIIRKTFMQKIKQEIKELAPYLIPALIVVLLVVALLSQVLPTAKELEPGAKVLLEMSGNLR